MFDTMSLGQKLCAKEFKEMEDALRIKLFEMQTALATHKLAMLITLDGVSNAGRGAVLNLLSGWLDGKHFTNHTFWKLTDAETERPRDWKYWNKLPSKGDIAVFFGGWYGKNIRLFAQGDLSEDDLQDRLREYNGLERTLADNGYIQLKLWLHLDKDEHKKRRKAREHENCDFHFTPYEKENGKKYDALIGSVQKIITATDAPHAPWHIIDAHDKHFRNVAIVKAIIVAIEKAIAAKEAIVPDSTQCTLPSFEDTSRVAILDRVDLSQTIEKEDYSKKIKALQNEVSRLSFEAYKEGISTTLMFEGWDAGGKGGNIRRIMGAVDARITRVIPISSPTSEDLAHHYLWRFWKHVPMAGNVVIFDRSWYGRVLVERVEGFAHPDEWRRAYTEINHFEKQVVDNKHILLKFWLQISPDEQLRRFEERQKIAWKNYKITDEDWRNREKTPAYMIAADEMFMRTSTNYAPWHIIPAESKYIARIETLTIYRDALRKALGKDCADKGPDQSCACLRDVKEMKKGKKSKK
ncbi:MAG: polyphosphate:AMP phosphotransferase [Pseudomonadota bacterium]